jgi:UDP-sugar transporter A1/2/3
MEQQPIRFLGLDSPLKISLFSFYVLMWALQGILVHNANKNVQFRASSIVLVQEIFKLIISFALFRINDGSLSDFFAQLRSNIPLIGWYLVPAGLYAVYNNLTFVGLDLFDPASYFVLMQFRIVVTGIMSVLVLQKQISKKQWIALTVIMIGAMFKEVPSILQKGMGGSNTGLFGYTIILAQLLLSTLAGVFNEKLLKGRFECSVNIQNFFMYIDSIVIILLWRLMSSSPSPTTTESSTIAVGGISALANPYLLPVILNASFLGVLTGCFLKYLNSVLKSIASAVELWVTAILSSVVFGYAFDAVTIAGIAIVTTGVYLYSVATSTTPETLHSKVPVVETEDTCLSDSTPMSDSSEARSPQTTISRRRSTPSATEQLE